MTEVVSQKIEADRFQKKQESYDYDDDDDFEKELESFIKDEGNKTDKDPLNVDDIDRELEQLEKGQREVLAKGVKENVGDESHSENDDWEADDYSITEDQKRALEELASLKNEMDLPDGDPPEYDVKDRLVKLNEELANEPTPLENSRELKVGFKDNLVDLVAPPPDFSDDESPRLKKESMSQEDEHSENITPQKLKPPSFKKREIVIERDGKFEVVSGDDVTANDLMMASLDSVMDKNNNRSSHSYDDFHRKPVPPTKPRPSTANGYSRRNVKSFSSKARPQSANMRILDDFNYNSPYALSKKQKELAEERAILLKEQMKHDEERKKYEEEEKFRENKEAFDYWLKQKHEVNKRLIEKREEEMRRNEAKYRPEPKELWSSKTMEFHQHRYLHEQTKESEDAFRTWVKVKTEQTKKEKLLTKRQEQEVKEGYCLRSRDECDQAFKEWLKNKNAEKKKTRNTEKQRVRMHRLLAKRSWKSENLLKALRQSNSFRYVDYYGYR